MKNIKSSLIKILGMLFALFAVLAVSATVFAASYPNKPLRLLVPFAPGGGADIGGRVIAAKLSERLGYQVIVENISGGGGIIAAERVAKSNPDGHTLLYATGANTIQAALINEKLPFDPVKSFTPIAKLVTGAYALVVHPSVPANSIKELIALAKQKPGQLTFVTSGFGATPHMGTELLKISAGIDVKIVHFKGQGPALIDLLGGHSQAQINSIPGFLPHIKSGKLRILGIAAAKRNASLPDVPTIAEAGVPGYEVSTWYGVLAPAGTPAPIVDRLNKEFTAITAMDEIKNHFLADGQEVSYLGPNEFGAFFEGEIANWARVIKKADLKFEE
jgi:tripartite-type tricarboxylate transporter receptor subunit TctC